MTTRLLVFGANGQVAQEIGNLGPSLAFEPVRMGRGQVDLLTQDIAAVIERTAPDAVVNAAAYTAVDRAETEPDIAFRLNGEAPGQMAKACRTHSIPFVHLSTDYVFDGTKATPYLENDIRAPLGVYGRSKAAGEDAVTSVGGDVAIVRTAWVYSAFGSNFVKTMLRLALEREEIAVVADQYGSPTWAGIVAWASLLLAQGLLEGRTACRGLFHAAGAGEASWADFAEAIFTESRTRGGPSARVRRITTAEFPTLARRPANSRLNCDRLTAATGYRPPAWRDSLSTCLEALIPSDAG
jgi:dTDP-4-dehydrorhamnose reductase